MSIGNKHTARARVVITAAVGLLLAGTAASAHADSMRSKQWHLDAMKAEEMWKASTGEGVTVAVIDSGVDDSNPDLRGRVLKGKDLAADTPGDEHTDTDGHGTGMAGLIAGTGERGGGVGAFGLAPGAKILPIRLTASDKANNQAEAWKDFNESAPDAIRYAADSGAKVINISLAVAQGSEQLTDSVKYALGKGSLIFAGVGNDAESGNALMYPAATPGVVGVGAIGRDLTKTKVSQYGPQVDLSAPGEDMIHACGGGTGMCETSGTSDATALASASAALIWSKHPDWTNNQVLRVMLNTAGGPVSGDERTDAIGYGIVRPRIALKTPGDPGPADEYPLPDLAAAESAKPSAEPSPAKGGSEANETPAAAAPATDDEGGNTALWVGLGVGAAALIGGAVAVAVVRSRRRSAATSAVPPYQQSQLTYPGYGPPSGAPEGQPPYGGPPAQGPRS
ncbi:type VII secretion-associated serine protease mycosin [Streptomyces sp. NBC_01237]|uniref:type VII secretion-associated serine protease mycosin n=1 Tax=Streptomyces sp. NBC_01237 TaxID=2903790 RepID=UPI002DDA057C|nr:type VII secretion-associated serine protease mycosin [Streptomyces sp. NBC_01237]WRZ72733.1 type VII secretion-associated serine protease mycosin [Streptomyces sp. NBC_01237]